MQHVNDDMDDVFRRAGKDYPLDTSGADWDKIAAGLQQPAVPVQKKQDNRKFLWLLLLLPLPWLCMEFTGKNKMESVAATQRSAQSSNVNDEKPFRNTTGELTVIPEQHTNPEEQPATVRTVNRVSENTPAATSENSVPHSRQIENSQAVYTRAQTSEKSAAVAKSIPVTNKKTKINSNRVSSSFNILQDKDPENLDETVVVSPDKIYSINQENPPQKTSITPGKVSNRDDSLKAGLNTRVDDTQVNTLTNNVENVAADNVSAVNTDTVSARQDVSPVTKTKTSGKPVERIYIAAIGGVGVTSIKGQKASDPGIDAGILLGYNISPRIAIEAAVLSTKKNYYSDGAYYDKAYVYMPPNSKLTTVTGDCRMIEIPVSVRYNFKNGSKGNWFATAGISNFLMQKENYNYTYYYFTTNYSATYKKVYENGSKDWAAVMQLSAGYNLKMKSFALRVEPYAQLPLRGAGYGELPLTSYGLRLGLQKGFRF